MDPSPPDENPLAEAGQVQPDAEVRQYADGVVDPKSIVNDNSYTYPLGLMSQAEQLTERVSIAPGHEPRYRAVANLSIGLGLWLVPGW